MAYSAAWSEAVPAGSLAAQDLDQAIRDAKRDIRERITGLFGMADWSADPLVMVSMKFGVNPATIGLIRAPNNVDIIAARNFLNTADYALLKVTAANIIEFGGGGLKIDPATGAVSFSYLQTYLINNAGIYARNAANTGNMGMIVSDITDNIRVAWDGSSNGLILGALGKKLGFFGGITLVAQQVVVGAKAGNAALTSLMAALGHVTGYALVTDNTT